MAPLTHCSTNLGSLNCYTCNLEKSNPVWRASDQAPQVALKLKELIINSHQLYSYVFQIHIFAFVKALRTTVTKFLCYSFETAGLKQIPEPYEHLSSLTSGWLCKSKYKGQNLGHVTAKLELQDPRGIWSYQWAQNIWDGPEILVEPGGWSEMVIQRFFLPELMTVPVVVGPRFFHWRTQGRFWGPSHHSTT